MSIFKEKKKLILSIIIDVFICITTLIILFFYLSNNTIQVSTPSNEVLEDSSIIVPNVTAKNTTFKISDTKNKVVSVNITVTNRLDEYNLCYYIDFNTDIATSINNTDYSLLNDTILIIDENCSIYFKYELNGNYSSEVYEIKISNIKVSKVTTEKVSEKELKEEKVDIKDVEKESTSPYFIKVNYSANVVTIYTKNEDGKYTVPYKAMICSCGKYTPKSGTYKTSNKYAWRPLVHDVYGQYATRIVKKILFHSVPYSSSKKDALLYEEYDKLGTKASEGCVRLTVKDAKWIYDNCPSGTMVEFYSDSNPGPLGKPTAQKISSVEECRNWDPTDPASNNPWHTYKKEDEKPIEDIQNNVTNNTTNNTMNNILNENTNTVVNNNIINDSIINNTTSEIINNIITNNTINEKINNLVVDNSNNNNSFTNTNSTVNNTANETRNNVTNNIKNESINNSVVDNTTVNNSSSSNSTTPNTNFTVNNTTLTNNIV